MTRMNATLVSVSNTLRYLGALVIGQHPESTFNAAVQKTSPALGGLGRRKEGGKVCYFIYDARNRIVPLSRHLLMYKKTSPALGRTGEEKRGWEGLLLYIRYSQPNCSTGCSKSLQPDLRLTLPSLDDNVFLWRTKHIYYGNWPPILH